MAFSGVHVAIFAGVLLSACGDSKEASDDAFGASPDAAAPTDRNASDSTRADAGRAAGETDDTARGRDSSGTSSDDTAGDDASDNTIGATAGEPGDAGSGETNTAPSTSGSDAGEGSLPEDAGSLDALGVSGALSPAFAPDVHEYELVLPVFATRAVLQLGHAPGTSVSVDGKLLDADERWVSPELDVGVTQVTVEISARGEVLGTYRIDVVRKEPTLSYLGNKDPDLFGYGYTTEVSADGNTLVIGPSDDSEGALGVWVFTRSGDEWSQETFLRHPNPSEADDRTWSLSLSRDGNTLVAGVFAVNAAYVFERGENGWELEAQLSADDTSAFGRTVEISGDGETIVVGDDANFSGAGGVYSFRRDGGRWQQQPGVLTLGSADPYQECSLFSIVLALDEQGETMAVVQSSLSWGCAGNIKLYDNAANAWSETATFGGSEWDVADSSRDADMNSDGTVLAVAGSGTEIYTRDGETWTPVFISFPVSETVELSDSGDTLFTEQEVYIRGNDTWLSAGDLEWPMAVPENVNLGAAASGDGTVLAFGPFVYSFAQASWEPVAEEPFGHTNCDERADVREDSCLYALSCDQEAVEAVCDRDATGAWSCTCYGETEAALKTMTTSSGEADTVCKAAASLCVDGLEPVSKVDECVRDVSSYDESCTLYTNCTTTTVVEGGISFEATRSEWGADCQPSAGGMDCNCEIYGSPGGTVSGASGPDACEIAQDYCEGKLSVGTDVACSEPETTQSDVGCETQRECGLRADIAGRPGVTFIAEPERSSAICSSEGGETSCSCSPAHGNGSNVVVAVSASELEDACRATDAACIESEEVEPSDDVMCSDDVYAEGDLTTCNAIADCGPAALYDGISVALTPRLLVACTQGSNEQWLCECTSGSNTLEFAATGVNSEAVCNGAVFTCVERSTGVDLHSEEGVALSFD